MYILNWKSAEEHQSYLNFYSKIYSLEAPLTWTLLILIFWGLTIESDLKAFCPAVFDIWFLSTWNISYSPFRSLLATMHVYYISYPFFTSILNLDVENLFESPTNFPPIYTVTNQGKKPVICLPYNPKFYNTNKILNHCFSKVARGSAAYWGISLQVGRSRVRFPMVSLEFFIDIILTAPLWPWGRLSL
jgi:hypothetical protein